jgi:hypothetical protein
MELLAAAFPVVLRTELFPAIGIIEDGIGDLIDMITTNVRLQKEIDAAKHSSELVCCKQLLMKEERQFTKAREVFWAWCTPQRLRDLRDGFDVMFVECRPRAGSAETEGSAERLRAFGSAWECRG